MSTNRLTGWTHVVLNYIGPNNGQGIQIYYNGEQTGSDDMRSLSTYQPGSGRVVIGRENTADDNDYASFHVDQLLFFNETLTEQNIQNMY